MTYKLSNYNYWVKHSENTNVFYNSISDKILILDDVESDRIKDLLNDIKRFERTYPSVFNAFCYWNYIIEENFNELNYLEHIYTKTIENEGSLDLIINPTLDCNFKCWYCFVTANVDNKIGTKMSPAIVNNIIKMIEKKILTDKINKLHICWFGGEPLLYYDEIFFRITSQVKSLCDSTNTTFINSIITNGYLLDNKKIKYMASINMSSIQITLDGDRARHNKIRNSDGGESYDIIINNFVQISKLSHGINLTIRINYDNQTLKNIDSLICDLNNVNRKNVVIDLERVWQVNVNDNVKEELKITIDKFITNGFKVKTWEYKPKQNIACFLDKKNSYVINYDGYVHKCVARDYKNPLGELNSDGEIIFNKSYSNRDVFKVEKCLKCKELPLCFGPCNQNVIEKKDIDNFCKLNEKETSINDYIIRRANEILSKNKSYCSDFN